MCCGRGCVGVGAQHCPLGLHALWGLRAAGVVGGHPRGGWPATVVRGVWCQALSLPRPPVLSSGQPGFRDPCVPGAVDAGVGTQHRPHSVRPCGRALLAVELAEGRPRAGAFHHCEGRLRSGAVPPPTARPLGRLLGPPPTCCGRGCVGVGAQHCPLGLHAPWGLRAAGVAGGRPRGGWPATVVRGVWCQALSLPRLPVLWSGQPGFRDPCVPGAVGAGVGTQHRPHNVRSCRPALLAVGVAERRSRGGAFHHCEGRLRSDAVPPPTARQLGGLLGSATYVLWARVCGCGGPTLSPWPACPVGAACRGGGGGPSPRGVACHRCEGRLVSGAVPPPAARPLERAARVLRPVCPGCGQCGRGDPAPAPRRAPLRAGVARGGDGRRASPGGVPSAVVRGALGAGAPPSPTARPLGGLLGLAGHWLWVLGLRAWGPVTNPTGRALACCGGGMRVPGGGASSLGVGRPGSGALPPPTARPLGGLPGPTTHWLWVRGGAGVGTRHQPQSARSCELALRALGAARGRPGGGASCLGVGRPGLGALPPPTTRPFGRVAGARFPLAVGAQCERGGPAVLGTLSRATVRRVLCALPGFAAPGRRCRLAPVLVPWLWPGLSGMPRGPALVRRSSSRPIALGAPVGFPVAVVPSPDPGAVAPGFPRWLRGARGGRPRTGLIVPAAGPCRGKGAGRAPRRTRRGPAMGLSLVGPSSFGLGLRALRWFGVCGPGH